VIDSRASENSIRRRRECEACHRRYTTQERAELKPPMVVKKDGRREAFQREKVLQGFRLACRKRPIAAGRIDDAVDRVEGSLLEGGEREVAAREIGRLVQEELGVMDPVAYLRFASVYQELESPEELLELVRAVAHRSAP